MQKKVEKLINKYKLNCNYETRYIDLVSEVGELGKELIKGSNYNSKEYNKTPNTKIELGDCLFSLFALCSELDINAEEALDDAINKYNNRFNETNSISSKID